MTGLVAGVVVEVAKMTKNWSPGLSPAGVVIVKGVALASAANPTVSIRARNASQDVRSIASSKEGAEELLGRRVIVAALPKSSKTKKHFYVCHHLCTPHMTWQRLRGIPVL